MHTFNDVWIGNVFDFESKTGPWIKTGNRTYVRYDIGPNAFYGEHKVGTVKVKAFDERTPPTYFWILFDKKGKSINYGEGYKAFSKFDSSKDPLLTSGILGDVVQMFSGNHPIPPGAKYITVYARGAERFKDMSDVGIPLGTYEKKTAGGNWRKRVFSPAHDLK